MADLITVLVGPVDIHLQYTRKEITKRQSSRGGGAGRRGSGRLRGYSCISSNTGFVNLNSNTHAKITRSLIG